MDGFPHLKNVPKQWLSSCHSEPGALTHPPVSPMAKNIQEELVSNLQRWEEELARHVAYLPVLCEMAGVTEHELHQAISIHFYVRQMTRSQAGGIQ